MGPKRTDQRIRPLTLQTASLAVSQGLGGVTASIPVFVAVVWAAPETTGRLAIVLSLALFAQGAARSIGGQILTLVPENRVSEVLFPAVRNAVAVAVGSSAISILIAAFGPFGSGWILIGLAVGVPLIVAVDLGRYVQFTCQRAHMALIIDVAWLVSMIGLLLLWSDNLTANRIYVAWAAGAAPAALIAGLASRSQLGIAVSVRTSDLAVLGRSNMTSLFADYGAGAGIAQLFFGVIAAIASVAVLGEYRGALLVFAPLPLLVVLLQVAWGPQVAAAMSSGRSAVRAAIRSANRLQGAVSMLWLTTVVLGAAVCTRWVNLADYLGDRWLVTLVCIGVGSVLANSSAVAAVAIRAAANGTLLLRARLFSAVNQLVLVAAGAAAGATFTIAIGFLLATMVNLRVWSSAAEKAVEQRIRSAVETSGSATAERQTIDQGP